MNIVIISGNLGRDPEMQSTPSGLTIASLSVGVNERKRQANGSYTDEVNWIRVKAFKNQAEACAKFLKKGSSVTVQGKLQTRTWQDKQSGQNRSATEVLASQVTFHDKPGLQAQAEPGSYSQRYSQGGPSHQPMTHSGGHQHGIALEPPQFTEDDIPF